eukprot:g929.t1
MLGVSKRFFSLTSGGRTANATIATTTNPPLRIGICGAGISGLLLASIVSKELGSRTDVCVFERSSIDRDQGYGLDLDDNGQEALARAGVSRQKYWNFSKQRSDSFVFHRPNGDVIPYAIIFRPKILQRAFPSGFGARPESNREGLRDALLAVIRDSVDVQFDTAVRGLEYDDVEDSAELLGDGGVSLGRFDLIVDAMGLHSTIRRERVVDDKGKHYDGDMMIHGMIENPEKVWSEDLLGRFGLHGTVVLAKRGPMLFFQRYGAGVGDNRVCMFYRYLQDSEEEAFRNIGIDQARSRRDGIIHDGPRLDKVKQWIVSDLGASKFWDPVWLEAIESMERVTVRGNYMHGEEVTLRSNDGDLPPLVCIGDSLRNCGLGGGAILACQDVIELANVLCEGNGRLDMEKIRDAEPEMLKRKVEFHEEKKRNVRIMRDTPSDDEDPSSTFSQMFDMPAPLRFFTERLVIPLFKAWYERDRRSHGGVGSTPESPVYPKVLECYRRNA